MNATINQSVVTLRGKFNESEKMEAIFSAMSAEVNSLTMIERCVDDEYNFSEMTMCYSSDDITAADIKACYSDAKKATR